MTTTPEPKYTCQGCGLVSRSAEPCVSCHGSARPKQQACSTCASYARGHCRRIDGEAEPWWTGCTLHVPARPVRQVQLGERWLCYCGKVHATSSPWLAAHWSEALQTPCECGRKWNLHAGTLTLEQ